MAEKTTLPSSISASKSHLSLFFFAFSSLSFLLCFINDISILYIFLLLLVSIVEYTVEVSLVGRKGGGRWGGWG
jgi:hypothetical protein